MVSRKISLFGKMQRGRSPSFELFQLDLYAEIYTDQGRVLLKFANLHVDVKLGMN